MKKIFWLLLLPVFGLAQNFAQYVNPFIGTGGHGHTFPGATLPYGMVQLSPDTRIDGSWDGCSGYHYSDSIIYGFSHTHLNGTGVSDYGDIMLMPTMGQSSVDVKDYQSSFSHQNEKVNAGFYQVKLDRENIDVRLTTSTRVGFHEYTFNKDGQANIVLDLNHRDKLLQGEVRIIDNKTIEVLRRSSDWAKDQIIFAQIEFNQALNISASKFDSKKENIYSGEKLALAFSKSVKKGEKILVKVTLSPTSYDGAKLNSSEIKDWNFNATKDNATKIWNKELSKIEVTTDDKDKLSVFYTALYHTMVQPNIAQDLDGKFRGRDNKVHNGKGFNYYSVFSLWDTFRAAHPLYTLIEQKKTSDFINTFITQYEEGGRLPVWELASNETDCMIGYHSVSVIADAMAKGIKGFDYEKAFEASKHSAMLDHLGLNAYKQNNFIAIDDEHENVSKTLEYAYDDWCIAQMALILNKTEDYNYFMNRSQNWKNVYDWTTGFMRPKKNGGWETPFDPREVNNNYTEGNSWHYSFFVPQDINGLIKIHGGPKNFEQKLDDMFNAESKTTGREQVDVTGLIGQYAQGNEPSHHMAYLYNYVGKPDKTKKLVHYILDEFYKNTRDGLIGNEDCGQMSAWYILSAMGIYNVTPGQAIWQTTEPYFDTIKINLEDGTSRTITKKTSAEDLAKLGFETVKPLQNLKVDNQTIVPVIEAETPSFKKELKVDIKSINPNATLFFMTLDENDANVRKTFVPYTKSFIINKTTQISAYSEENGKKSAIVTAQYYKKPNDFNIRLISQYLPQYHGSGDDALIDGIKGSENWRKGYWQGFWGKDFEAVIDMKQATKVNEVDLRFLQDSRSWILLPTAVEFWISDDDKNYTLYGTQSIDVNPKDDNVFIKETNFVAKQPKQARFIKIKAKNFGKLPADHIGAGGDAYIFMDEISIK